MNIPTPRGELSCTSKASTRVNMTFIPCENPVECQIKSGYLSWVCFFIFETTAKKIVVKIFNGFCNKLFIGLLLVSLHVQFDFDARSYSSESIFSDEDGDDAHNTTTISQGYIRSGIIKCGVSDYITTKFAIANLDTLCTWQSIIIIMFSRMCSL